MRIDHHLQSLPVFFTGRITIDPQRFIQSFKILLAFRLREGQRAEARDEDRSEERHGDGLHAVNIDNIRHSLKTKINKNLNRYTKIKEKIENNIHAINVPFHEDISTSERSAKVTNSKGTTKTIR